MMTQVVPRQLPRDVTHFVNRELELNMLDQLLTITKAYDHHQTSGFATIAGAPGVGKTALAIHWAHRVRHEFPDGDLYVDLGGQAESRISRDEALDGFLRALGVSADQIPSGLDARSALLR